MAGLAAAVVFVFCAALVSSGLFVVAAPALVIGFLRSSMFLTREKSCSYCSMLPSSNSELIGEEPDPAAIIYSDVASYSNPISHV